MIDNKDEIEKKISVIIPVYNVAKYLRQCINSVLNQTLEEIEIIIVDDGSTDGSEKICDEYALYDNRIKVIHKSNEGLSCARNDGIDASTAPFIMFVDSDDWVETDFCKTPYENAIEHDVDLVFFSYNKVFYNDEKEIMNGIEEGLISKEEALYYDVFVSNAAWFALYRRTLFDFYRFPKGKYYEDLGTVHRLIHVAEGISFVDTALYNHRVQRPGSITTVLDRKHVQDMKEMYNVRIKDLLSWGYDNYAQKLALSVLVKYGSQEGELVNVAINAKTKKLLNWKQRMMLNILRISPMTFDAICSTTGKRVMIPE